MCPLACQPRGKGTIQKQLGSTFHFRCPIRTSCKGKDYIYTHYNQVTGTPAVVFEGKRFARKISSLDYGGDYCCTDQCSSSQSGPKCCITVASKSIINCATISLIASYMLCTCICLCSFTCGTMGFAKSCCSSWKSCYW